MKESKLEKFSMPNCNVCKTECQIEFHDNGACGDPDCCGEFEEWVVLFCPKCTAHEELIN